MKKLYLEAGSGFPYILVEEEAHSGVKKIAEAVAKDVELVLGQRPEISGHILEGSRTALVFATIGKSPLLERLAEADRRDLEQIRGKREVFAIRVKEHPWPELEQAVMICGSDKRGTIYGMFTFSEYIGVPPLAYWGDAVPERKERVLIDADLQQTSIEPGVRFRGFFINDEWPCFGNWASSHFGGINVQAYEHVFELLLRLKGNYLWPAMWSSCFSKDGPGLASARLADLYGVVMGTSHHEPCMRAGEEFRQENGSDTPYQTRWNFAENEEGLTNFWKDGLLRNRDFENLITIGMRGEQDSVLLGEDSGLEENVEQLKRIIAKQRELIREWISGGEPPQLLVVYKEVEQYFHGDGDVPGLKDWDGLDGVTLMLCEDNFGYLRSLPGKACRNRPGGWGMYYHVDYHGAPVSYEWVDSTPLSMIWEQMSTAYEYGIRDVWIVNVGDVKFHEVSLSYFMELAYRYQPWTEDAPYHPQVFLNRWAALHFPDAGTKLQNRIAKIAEGYIRMNGMRRPEALHAGIYHPCHHLEGNRMLELADRILEENEAIYHSLSGSSRDAYYSMVYYPAKASMNLLRLHLYAGKNAHYAAQAKPVANRYAKLTEWCMQEDKDLAAEFAVWKQGKWSGMEQECHIGFTRWDNAGCRYPLRTLVTPLDAPHMAVSRADGSRVAVRAYGSPEIIAIDDFLYGFDEGCQDVWVEVANLGTGSLQYHIELEDGQDCPWLSVDPAEGTVSELASVKLTCDRSKLSTARQDVRLLVRDGETTVALWVSGKATDKSGLLPGTFLEADGRVVMEADHYCCKKDTLKGGFARLEHHGRSGHGIRVCPVTACFGRWEEKPEVSWRFLLEQAGLYCIEFWMTPCNPVEPGQHISYGVCLDQEPAEWMDAVPEGYEAGGTKDMWWCQGALDHIRKNTMFRTLPAGVHELTVQALEPGLALERIVIWREDRPLAKSYLGPLETPRK